MSTNVLFVGWQRATPGREASATEHFQQFAGYLNQLQEKQEIDSFEPVLLVPGGGQLNGFFLIRGDHAALDRVMATNEWRTHVLRSMLHLDGYTLVRGSAGAMLQENLGLWASQAGKLS